MRGSSVWLLVAIAAVWLSGPVYGQGWTYQPIGQGFQSDDRQWKEEENSLDYRFISYLRNLQTGSLFRDADGLVSNVQLAVDENREQLLVGGRDVLYRLHLNNLTLLERAEWESTEATVTLCTNRGRKEAACRNFVRVLILVEDTDEPAVFSCGTNAFNPKCTWRNVSHLADVSKTTEGRGICPFSPDYNATSLMSKEGSLYTATVIDFEARDPAILRRAEVTQDTLRTMKENSKWLNEPNFVSTYEIGNFVYFFFRETAVEFMNCGKKVYSRVARVCKSDKGGYYSLENTWTTFLKARLNCSLPGQYPFYFDELQSTFYSPEEELVYAVFSTPQNSIAGSAVCVYNMESFQAAFEGPYKVQEDPSSAWVSNTNHFSERKCSATDSNTYKRSSSKSHDFFMAAMKYQLMDRAISSRETEPLIMRENERWTHIVVDHVLTKNGYYDVLFLATDDGKIRKMMRLPDSQTTCLIEEIKIVENGASRPVQNMKISPIKGAVYVSTQGKVLKVPVQRCYRFTTALMCSGAQDPYCGWNTITGTCTPAPDENPHTDYWEQNILRCPILSYPINGGWGQWSAWSVCSQVGLDRMVDHCLCRSRHCDNPRPANRGLECRGPSMEVSNCTVHGAWTQWSEWSACSQTCGFATKTRSRQCGNPPPKFGGNDCNGEATERQYCNGNPECPLTPVDGQWSLWSGWSSCTRKCNSGIQTRKRACDRPVPMRGGNVCGGNNEQWRMCNTQRCTEMSKISPWTEWVQTNRTEGGYFQQRFRFTCRANVERSKDIKTSFAKSQAQFCFKNGQGCYGPKDLSNTVTSIDTFSSVDRVLKRYCWKRRKYLKNRYCRCRTLGVFLVCRKCEIG